MGPGKYATHHVGLCSFVGEGGGDPAGDAREYHVSSSVGRIRFQILGVKGLRGSSQLLWLCLYC